METNVLDERLKFVTDYESGLDQPSAWKYPQRVDVRSWQHVVPAGVLVSGLSESVGFPTFRRAIFEVQHDFFKRIVESLLAS